MAAESLSVSEVLTRAQDALVGAFPAPIWVVGEVSGFRRTSGGAAFFRLADPDDQTAALEVAARGMVMGEIDRTLGAAGLGSIRDGVGVRVNGTIGVETRGSRVRLALLEIDPEFTVGRLALERAALIERMTRDGSIRANGQLPIPLVPLTIGVITSRGSAAHADFTHQLERSGYRFRVVLRHTVVQGERAPGEVAGALTDMATRGVDVIALVRGGGSRLDLAVFDSEAVAHSIATSPVPVLTGIGHETDRTVADEAAAHAEKTPSAAAEWLVGRVADFAGRLERARYAIGRESKAAVSRHHATLSTVAAGMTATSQALGRELQRIDHLTSDIAASARRTVERRHRELDAVSTWIEAVDIDKTLRRGFSIVTRSAGGEIVRSSAAVEDGERLAIRFADGTVEVEVTGR